MRALWIAYILIGLGAFFISFFMEYKLFKSTIDIFGFAFCITFALEGAKVFCVIFHRLIEDRNNCAIPDNIVTLCSFSKIGLLILSLICSIAMFSKGMDRPNLDSIKDKDRTLVTDSYSERIAMIQEQREGRLGVITGEVKEKFQRRYAELDSRFLPKIQQKEALRDAEFSNQVGGVRKGPYWMEHNRQARELEVQYKTEKDVLRRAENAELEGNITSIENEFQTKLDDSLSEKITALSSISKEGYKNDERTKNALITAFLSTLNHGFGLEMQYLTFALLFSLLTSVLLEVTIYLTFSYVTLFYNTVLNPAKEEFVYVNQAKPSPEPEVGRNAEAHEEPINDENLYVHRDIDPSTANYFQHLQNQFQTSDTPDFDNPCGQEGG
jgi:hypothetical protein